MRPLPKEPDSEHKKKTSKIRVPVMKGKRGTEEKLVISHPTDFIHTLHVGFNANTGEFTVSIYIFKYTFMVKLKHK